jgi:hypothetical protein
MDRDRALEIQTQIGDVLMRDWDPIGAADEPQASGEYQAYVGGVHGLIASGASADEIAQHLGMLEETQLGLRRRTHADLLPVARKLRAIPARLERGLGAVDRDGALPRKLYSPRQIAGGALLASPLAGGFMLAENFRVLGRAGARMQALLGAAIATAILMALSFFLPLGWPASALPAGYSTALFLIARRTQGAAFEAHVASGGARVSNWQVFGISLATLLLALGIYFLVLLVVPYRE